MVRTDLKFVLPTSFSRAFKPTLLPLHCFLWGREARIKRTAHICTERSGNQNTWINTSQARWNIRLARSLHWKAALKLQPPELFFRVDKIILKPRCCVWLCQLLLGLASETPGSQKGREDWILSRNSASLIKISASFPPQLILRTSMPLKSSLWRNVHFLGNFSNKIQALCYTCNAT